MKRSVAKNWGKLMRQKRKQLSLTHEVLAERADLHPTYISLLERGKRLPCIDKAERIARALGVSLSAFIAEGEQILDKEFYAR